MTSAGTLTYRGALRAAESGLLASNDRGLHIRAEGRANATFPFTIARLFSKSWERVDLELVTGDYHAQALASKGQTGFAMYALPADAARLRPAMSDPEIMLDILSL